MYVAGNDGNGDLDEFRRPTFFGGTYPAAWADYMAKATEGQPVRQFAGPAYVNKESSPLLLRPARASRARVRSRRKSRPTADQRSDPDGIREELRRAPKPTSPTTTAPNAPSTSQPTAGGRRAAAEAPPGRG